MFGRHLGGENGQKHVFTAILERLWAPIAPKRNRKSKIGLGISSINPLVYVTAQFSSTNFVWNSPANVCNFFARFTFFVHQMAPFLTSRSKMQLRVAARAPQKPTDFGRSSSDSARDIRDQSFSLYEAPSGEHRFFSDDFLPKRSFWPARSVGRIAAKSIMTFSRNRRSQFFENVQYVQKNVYMKRLDDDRWDCRNQLSAESPICCIELLHISRRIKITVTRMIKMIIIRYLV